MMTHAESVGDAPCPSVMCRWRYDARGVPDYRSGIGEGVAGIAYAFDLFAVRTGDLSLRQYATAAAAYLESLITKGRFQSFRERVDTIPDLSMELPGMRLCF